MTGLLLTLVFFFIVNLAVSFLVSLFVPNYYLASMLTSIIIAFIYSILNVRFDRKHFYKMPMFWSMFFITGTIFLVFDFLTFIL